jgi:hypothetical protein
MQPEASCTVSPEMRLFIPSGTLQMVVLEENQTRIGRFSRNQKKGLNARLTQNPAESFFVLLHEKFLKRVCSLSATSEVFDSYKYFLG